MKGLRSLGKGASGVMGGMLGANAITAGLGAARNGIREVTDEFLNLDQNVTGAAARWGEDFKRGSAGFKSISDSARQVASDTEFMASETSTGLDFFARAGLKAATSIGLLPGVADLATAANFDFAQSADIATDALGAFGKNEGTTEQKISSFNKIMNQAAKTANMSNMDIGMWFETLKKFGPASVAAGQDMDQMNSAMAILAGSGLKAEVAGTQLRQMLLKIADPASKGKKALQSLGVEIADDNGNFKNLSTIIGDIKDGMKGLGEVKQVQLMKRIFGVRQVSAAKVLFKAGAEGIEDLSEKIKDSDGFVGKLAATMRGSMQNRLAKLKSQTIELGLKFFDTFGPKIEQGLKSVTKWVEAANKNHGKWIKTLKEVGMKLGDVFKWMSKNKEMIIGLIKAYAGFRAAGFVAGLTNVRGLFQNINSEMASGVKGAGAFQGALSKINAGAAGLAIGSAIGFAIWQVLEAKSKQRQARENRKRNRAVGTSRGLSSAIREGSATQIGIAEQEIRKKWKGLDLSQVERRIGEGKTRGYGSDLQGDISLLQRARARKAELLEQQRLGRGNGMFGTNFSQLPQSRMGSGQGAITVSPSFDVFVTNKIDKDGNTQSDVEMKPTTQGLPSLNPVGALP
jgi:TP901 family phage tail tape measure protein